MSLICRQSSMSAAACARSLPRSFPYEASDKKPTNTIDVEIAMRDEPIDPQTPHVAFILCLTIKGVRKFHFRCSAELTASSRTVSLNGLNRHSTAPRSSSRVRTVLSVLAVMKMIGISRLRRDNSRWRSGPDIPGNIETSRIRHLVWSTQSDARNAAAGGKHCAE